MKCMLILHKRLLRKLLIAAVGLGAVVTICYGLFHRRLATEWQFQADNSICSVLLDRGTVYVASCDGKVYALNDTTGIAKWSYDMGGPSTDLIYGSSGTIYAGSDCIVALNPATGHPNWVFRPPSGRCHIAAGLHGRLYAGADRVYALNATTGKPLWNAKMPAAIDICLVDVLNTLYVVTEFGDSQIYAIDANTGKTKWKSHIKGGVSTITLSSKGTIVAQVGDHDLCAIASSSGNIKWRTTAWGDVLQCPVTTVGQDDVVYVADASGHVSALDGQTGKKRWYVHLDGATAQHNFLSPPTISRDQRLYVGIGFDNLYTLDAKTGAVQNRVHLANFLDKFNPVAQMAAVCITSPVIGPNGDIYVGTASGKVCAIQR